MTRYLIKTNVDIVKSEIFRLKMMMEQLTSLKEKEMEDQNVDLSPQAKQQLNDMQELNENLASESQPAIDTSMYDQNIIDIKQNRIVSGRVVDITDKGIFVDIGFKSEGMVMKDEFTEIPDINDEIKVFIKSNKASHTWIAPNNSERWIPKDTICK